MKTSKTKPFKQQKPIKPAKVSKNFADDYENPKKWYQELPDEPTDFPKVTEEQLINLKDEAKKCNDAEIASYNIKNTKTNSDYQWMKTVMSKGTISDKIAAYVLLIQDDPVCNLPTLRDLINMVKVGKKHECFVVMDNLSELFLSDLLRPDSKLRPFYTRPLSKLDELSSGNSITRRKYLSYWYFEDQLKECYTMFVQALNTAAHDSVESNKEKALNAMYRLLVGNSEQEKNLLAHIVNKLGDPSQKVASKAIYCLGQVLYEHPNMKQVVLNEIERLLFRPNVSPKAQYYGVCFLTQFCLSVDDYDVAKNLIGVYFAFFKGCIKKGEVDTRLMSALLMGVNRAYPYAKTELNKISEHIDTMYKVVHIATFNVSLHALNLLLQVSDHNESINDRFYTVLYKKLLDPQVSNTTHQALFLNLIFRALKRDRNANRVKAFIKRLLQMTLYMQPPMACGILYLINQITYKKNHLLALNSKNSTDLVDDNADEYEHYTDVQTDEPVQEINQSNTSEQNKEVEPISTGVNEIKPLMDIVNTNTVQTGSWLHCNKAIKKEYNHPPVVEYNCMQRNPLYAGGEFCSYTELIALQKHYHPTISLYANKLLNAQKITYSGDPLKDFTLIRFLERFSFKNPKKTEDVQKAGINSVFGKRKLKVPIGVKSYAVNSKNYLNMKQDKIPVEELFLYTYLHRKHKDRKTADEDDDVSDADSVGSEEFEEMLDKMAGGKKFDNDDDLDFMNEIGDALKETKKTTNTENEENKSDSDESDEDDNDFGDQSNDFGDEDLDDMDDNEDFDGMADDNEADDESDDFEGEPLNFDSDEDEPPQKSSKKAKKNNDIKSMFASADDFASLLDEEQDFMAGTSNAVANKDNAHLKQLNWEQNRNKWVKGGDKAFGNKKFNKKSFGGKKRPQNQAGNKNKKRKKS